MTTFGEDEWEGSLYSGKWSFKHQNKARYAAASKAKGRVPWHNDGVTPKINSKAIMIDWMQLVTITIDGAAVINKMVLQISYCKWND